MTQRPPHRWKSFWFGIVVLTFLGWAWRDSFLHPFHATRFQPPRYYQVFHIEGEIVFRHGDDGGSRGSGSSWWLGKVDPTLGSMAENKGAWDRNGQTTYRAIPHAAVVGISALCFGGFVVWRIRRWNRLAVESTATADGS